MNYWETLANQHAAAKEHIAALEADKARMARRIAELEAEQLCNHGACLNGRHRFCREHDDDWHKLIAENQQLREHVRAFNIMVGPDHKVDITFV